MSRQVRSPADEASRVIRRVFCERDKGAHVLATVRAGGVEVSSALQYVDGVSVHRSVFTADDVAGLEGLAVHAVCACGLRYRLDVVALLRGEDKPPVRLTALRDTGVSERRRRPTVQ